MNSPAKSIAWELWGRNRWALTAVAAAIPVLCGIHLLVDSREVSESMRVVELLWFLFSLTSLFWTFCLVEVDPRGRHAGFPSRMFTLPLKTATLAGLPMVYGALAIGGFYLFWTALIFPSWDVRLSASWIRAHVLSLVAMLLSLQAIVWSFYRFPWIRFAMVLVALVGIAGVGIVPAANDFRPMSERAVLAIMGGVTLVAVAGGIAGVARDRRGEWEGWTRRALDAALNAIPGRRHGFGSGSDAQVWFEWRGKGIIFAPIMGVVMAAGMTVYPLPTLLHFDPATSAITYANVPMITLIAAWSFGMALAKTDYWSRDSALSPFVTTRPVSSGNLVVARLKTAAIIIFVAAVLFAIQAVPVFNTPSHFNRDGESGFPSWPEFVKANPAALLWLTNPVILLTLFATTWHTMAEGLAIGLLGRGKSIWQSVSRIAVFLGALIFLQWFARQPGGLRAILAWLPWASGALAGWKVLSTVFYMHRARGLYSTRQLVWLAGLWVATTALLAWTASLVWTDIAALNRVIAFIAVYLAPGAGLARCALNLHANRHR